MKTYYWRLARYPYWTNPVWNVQTNWGPWGPVSSSPIMALWYWVSISWGRTGFGNRLESFLETPLWRTPAKTP